jgi:hypothetical protein
LNAASAADAADTAATARKLTPEFTRVCEAAFYGSFGFSKRCVLGRRDSC